MAYAVYRGQRFNVVSEDARFVTLEGFGYKKRVQKEEVIFEEKPEDTLLAQSDGPVELLAKEEEKPLPTEIPDKGLVPPPEVTAAPEVAPVFEEDSLQLDQVKAEFEKLREYIDLDDMVENPKLHKFLRSSTPTVIEILSKPDLKKEDYMKIAGVLGEVYGVGVKEAMGYLSNYDDLTIKESLKRFLADAGPESASTPAPEVENKQQPDLKKVGLNLSVDTTPDRRAENEKRRKDFVGTMKSKLQEMLTKLEEMDLDDSEDEEEVKIEENETVAPTNIAGPGTTSDSAVPFAARIGTVDSRKRDDEKLNNVK